MLGAAPAADGTESDAVLPIRPILVLLLLAPGFACADVVPAPLFQDHAVLQQGVSLPVWGSADEGENVTVRLAGQTVSTVAHGGRWEVRLAALPAGGPHVLTLEGRNKIEIHDVLIGEVWVCSGQSNMERQLGLRDGQKPIENWEEDAASAHYPQIRHFGVAQRLSGTPETTVGGEWLVCSRATAPQFSAVGFFFGRALHTARKVPVGLIHAAWGGSPVEAWTSRHGLLQVPETRAAVAQLDQVRQNPAQAKRDYERDMARWFAMHDPGSSSDASWGAASLDVATWAKMKLPVFWESAGLPQFDGVVWMRREIEVPSSWIDRDVELHLGAIDDSDTTWVNGRLVGTTNNWLTGRIYRLPRGTLKAGRNVIAVRVLDTGGGGGLWGGDAMRLALTDGSAPALSLVGEWRYKVSFDLANVSPPPFDPSLGSGTATVLYNGMIAPLVPYALRGVIWYQGEANSGQADLYRRLFPTLVADWRMAWGQGKFPFLYVQIAPFAKMPPEIREAQRLSLSTIENSAMAVTLDVGDANDIHPTRKRPVGERLALAARALAYGEEIEFSGPLLRAAEFIDSRAIVHFTHVGGGLEAKEGDLRGFSIAGADRQFHPARARIVGETVEVSADEVPAPVAVRYAWADVPEGNLYNKEGLPASPFDTASK